MGSTLWGLDKNELQIGSVIVSFCILYFQENVKYAVRLRNHGGRTSNGDGGVSSVKGPDGVTFNFSTCSLNFNGTTPTRGQIPYVLYFRCLKLK